MSLKIETLPSVTNCSSEQIPGMKNKSAKRPPHLTPILTHQVVVSKLLAQEGLKAKNKADEIRIVSQLCEQLYIDRHRVVNDHGTSYFEAIEESEFKKILYRISEGASRSMRYLSLRFRLV